MDVKEKSKKNRTHVTVEEINKYNLRSKVLKISAVAAVVLLIIVYVFSALYKQSGSFTVSVNKHEMVTYGLSLCETKDLAKPTSVLNMRQIHI